MKVIQIIVGAFRTNLEKRFNKLEMKESKPSRILRKFPRRPAVTLTPVEKISIRADVKNAGKVICKTKI